MSVCLIFQVFKEQKYLDEALSCAEVVWSRGLLKKGYGICHGVSGNAYTFLVLFKLTQDPKYLHRALKVSTVNQHSTQHMPFISESRLYDVVSMCDNYLLCI